MEAFVYCWTDKIANKLYVGVHKGSVDDGYICSSKIVKEEYKKRPNDFSRQIIACGTYEDMYKLETKILQTENVIQNKDFYNIAMNNGYFKNKGLPLSQEHKNNISSSIRGEKHPFFGKNHSKDSKEKMRDSRKKYMIENNQSMSKENHPMWNRPHTEEHKNNIKKALQGKQRSEQAKSNAGHGRSGCYLITTPNGEKIKIKNLALFCKEHNLNHSNLWNRGKSKGYFCEKLEQKEL